MQIEPAAEAFAARYAAGEPQVVWTTLVADLETPVSAFLKITAAEPNFFADHVFARSRSRAARSAAAIPSSDLSPTSFFASTATCAEINRAPQNRSDGIYAAPACRRCRPLRALIAESRIALPDASAADGRRRLRLSRLRHGAADGGFPGRAAFRSDRHSRRHSRPADAGRRVRRGRRYHHRGHAGAAAGRRDGEGGAGSRRRTPVRDRRCARPAARQIGRRSATPARSRWQPRSNTTPDEFKAHGAAGQGIHLRRRHFSGRAVAALRGAVRAAAVCALSRAAARQSVALSVLPRFRRLRGRRLEPGNPGQDPRRHRDHPPDRRHPPARRHAARGQGARGRSCSPTPRSAPSI